MIQLNNPQGFLNIMYYLQSYFFCLQLYCCTPIIFLFIKVLVFVQVVGNTTKHGNSIKLIAQYTLDMYIQIPIRLVE